MSDNIVRLPGCTPESPSGEPRPDIADMLEAIATRARRGEIDALGLVYSIVDGGMAIGVSTPENAYYSMLGVCDELKDMIKERAPARQRVMDRD